MHCNQVLLALGICGSAKFSTETAPSCSATAQWPGWAAIKYAFIFGDSYTQTGFNYQQTPAPSPSNPLGNPAYPGYTSSGGPNWVGFLTVKYNASRLQTYNFAYGGAVVDEILVTPYRPEVQSLKQQVFDEFVPGYTTGSSGSGRPSAPSAPTWHGNDSVFAVWIGINDVGNSYGRGESESKLLNQKIVVEYGRLVDRLYEAGARNIALLTVPPVDRSPLTAGQGSAAQAAEKASIAQFNGLVRDMAASMQEKHAADANVWVFDTAVSFNRALDDPKSYPQTSQVTDTTGYCPGSCGTPVKYFWLNNLHPTSPIHDVVAEQLAKSFTGGPNVCSSS